MKSSEGKKEACIALGFFDCVHYGHRVLIDQLLQASRRYGAMSIISTFVNNIYEAFDSDTKLIYSYPERKQIVRSLGVDRIRAFRFNAAFKNMLPAEFLQAFLADYAVRYIVCGYDYRFGKGGSGDVQLLKDFCNQYNIEFHAVDQVTLHGSRVSSTLIRSLLSAGEIERANQFLVSPYFIQGKVVPGRGEGRLFNIPTANIACDPDKLVLKSGVYATKTMVGDKSYPSVTNIGIKPTFEDYAPSNETLIGGFSGDLYGKEIQITFYKFLRGISRFDSKEALVTQIYQDLDESKEIV